MFFKKKISVQKTSIIFDIKSDISSILLYIYKTPVYERD